MQVPELPGEQRRRAELRASSVPRLVRRYAWNGDAWSLEADENLSDWMARGQHGLRGGWLVAVVLASRGFGFAREDKRRVWAGGWSNQDGGSD